MTDYSWRHTVNQNWNNSGNWTPAGVPNTSNDKAIYDGTSSQQIVLDATITCGAFDSTAGGASDAILDLNANALTITDAGSEDGSFIMANNATQTLDHGSNSSLTITGAGDLTTAALIEGNSANQNRMQLTVGSGTWRFRTASGADVYVRDLTLNGTTFRPQSITTGRDINTINQLHIDGTVTADTTDTGDNWGIEILQKLAELDIVGTNNATIDGNGVLNLEHEGSAGIQHILAGSDTVTFIDMNTYDITGGSGGYTWNMDGDLKLGTTLLTLEKDFNLIMAGYTLYCGRVTCGDGTAGSPELQINGGLVIASDSLRVRNATVDLGAGGGLAATFIDGPDSTRIGTFDGSAGSTMYLDGVATPGGTLRYIDSVVGDNSNDGESAGAGNAWLDITQVEADIIANGGGKTYVFNADQSHTIPDGTTLSVDTVTNVGRYGTGEHPKFIVGDTSTFVVGRDVHWYESSFRFGDVPVPEVGDFSITEFRTDSLINDGIIDLGVNVLANQGLLVFIDGTGGTDGNREIFSVISNISGTLTEVENQEFATQMTTAAYVVDDAIEGPQTVRVTFVGAVPTKHVEGFVIAGGDPSNVVNASASRLWTNLTGQSMTLTTTEADTYLLAMRDSVDPSSTWSNYLPAGVSTLDSSTSGVAPDEIGRTIWEGDLATAQAYTVSVDASAGFGNGVCVALSADPNAADPVWRDQDYPGRYGYWVQTLRT